MSKGQKHLPKRPSLIQHKTRFIRTSDFKPKVKLTEEEEPSRWPVISALIGIPLFIGFAIVGVLSMFTGKQIYPEYADKAPAEIPAIRPLETKAVVTENSTPYTDYGPPPTPVKHTRAPGSSDPEDIK